MFPWRCLHQKCSDIVAGGQYRSSGPRVRGRTHPANASGWNIETVCLHLCAQLSAFWSTSRRHRLLSAAVKPDNENTTKWQQTKPSNYSRFTSLHYQHTHTHTAWAQPSHVGAAWKLHRIWIYNFLVSGWRNIGCELKNPEEQSWKEINNVAKVNKF